MLPEEIHNYDGLLVFTTKKESPKQCKKILLHEDILEHHPTVIRGMMMQKLNLYFEEENLILGVDPGQRMGLSIFYYGVEIERSVHTSIEELVFHIISILGGLRAKRKILKIGDGNMNIAKQIVRTLNLKFCSSFELEFVDETKTSLKIKNFNQRGKRDMLSAKYISQRDGYRQSILPLSMTG
ncbi:hypothetical protein [Nitrosopumilus sp.]|uniref:hypothetical protein n=1 Tax=Nitrosopumilus sp. TaxID=2024843 RepID=UPI00247CC8F1|nr:hypothetical protein [Nitrosopumilus sp.]MCV0430961.1 hypothetical protein [Nitrosopumilus sp.]